MPGPWDYGADMPALGCIRLECYLRENNVLACLSHDLLSWPCQSLSLCGSQKTVENSSRDGNIRPLTCLLRNLYEGQEVTVRTGHGTDWFQIGKGVHQGCIVSPFLFNLYAEHVMRNVGLEEAQAGIKIAGRYIKNLRYAYEPSLWQKVKN